jgi:hypothetical protein
MIALIGQVLTLVIMLLGKWFELSSEKKAKAKELLKEVPNVSSISDITRTLDAINRL